MTLHPLTHDTAFCHLEKFRPSEPGDFAQLVCLSALAVNLHTAPAEGLSIVTEAELIAQEVAL